MENIETRRLSLRRVEQPGNVQRFAFQPRLETWRGQQIIQRHREREPFLGRVERFQIQHSDSRHGRRLYRLDQSRQVEVATLFPRVS